MRSSDDSIRYSQKHVDNRLGTIMAALDGDAGIIQADLSATHQNASFFLDSPAAALHRRGRQACTTNDTHE